MDLKSYLNEGFSNDQSRKAFFASRRKVNVSSKAGTVSTKRVQIAAPKGNLKGVKKDLSTPHSDLRNTLAGAMKQKRAWGIPADPKHKKFSIYLK